MRKIGDANAAGGGYALRRMRHGFSSVAIATLLVLALAGTTFAAWLYLNPGEIAEDLGDGALSAAFESDSAVNINQSATSGGYIFTLLAVVSGNDITDMPYYKNGEVSLDRTYAVIAIQNSDGSPMTIGSQQFFATPLVKGLKPWQVNAASLGGGYSETVVDGVLYRLVECDDITMFADRGLYFAVCTDAFISNSTFRFDEPSGEIGVNPDYGGASAVFDLPIHKSFADPEKAKQYLNGLSAPATGEGNVPSSGKADGKQAETQEPFAFSAGGAPSSPEVALVQSIDWEKAVPVASTAKELAVADNGEIIYPFEYENGEGNAIAFFGDCFQDDGSPQSKIVRIDSSIDTEGNVSVFAIRFSLDEDGIVTGVIVVPA
jgi:hypothetical protein